MLFSSFTFLLVFLPVVVVLFWLVPRGLPRLTYLVVISCVFYGLWDWRYVPLLLAATLVDWVAGHYIARAESPAAAQAHSRGRHRPQHRPVWLLQVPRLLRGFDERAPGSARRGRAPARAQGASADRHLVLHVRGISYAVDVYRGTIKPAKSVIHYLAWVTLFPYILAGPIIRYEHVGQQLEGAQQRFRWALIGTGLFFLVMGLAKKMLFADMLAPYVNDLFAHHAELGLLSGWGAALGYTLQLYFDFSGYSDMAVGVALMIGLRFPQNFNSPYKAANVSDFWRRWHMTLSGWLRDYLFIPLGGSRGDSCSRCATS